MNFTVAIDAATKEEAERWLTVTVASMKTVQRTVPDDTIRERLLRGVFAFARMVRPDKLEHVRSLYGEEPPPYEKDPTARLPMEDPSARAGGITLMEMAERVKEASTNVSETAFIRELPDTEYMQIAGTVRDSCSNVLSLLSSEAISNAEALLVLATAYSQIWVLNDGVSTDFGDGLREIFELSGELTLAMNLGHRAIGAAAKEGKDKDNGNSSGENGS